MTKQTCTRNLPINIMKMDEDKHTVFGVVYPINKLDTYGDFADAETVKSLCEQFESVQKFDIMHDHKEVSGVKMLRNYISEGEEDILAGAWVQELEITNMELWGRIKSGELNGFSMDILTYLDPVIVTIEFSKIKIEETEEAEDHTHLYVILNNEDGNVDYGRTSTDEGHAHTILRGTATEESVGHKHRIMPYRNEME